MNVRRLRLSRSKLIYGKPKKEEKTRQCTTEEKNTNLVAFLCDYDNWQQQQQKTIAEKYIDWNDKSKHNYTSSQIFFTKNKQTQKWNKQRIVNGRERDEIEIKIECIDVNSCDNYTLHRNKTTKHTYMHDDIPMVYICKWAVKINQTHWRMVNQLSNFESKNTTKQNASAHFKRTTTAQRLATV